MDHTEAKDVLSLLARGIDPETGELLPPDHLMHSARIIRALFVAIGTLDPGAGRRAQPAPEHAGGPWPAEEDDRLKKELAQGMAVAAIASAHGRTRGAIRSRIKRLERIAAGGES